MALQGRISFSKSGIEGDERVTWQMGMFVWYGRAWGYKMSMWTSASGYSITIIIINNNNKNTKNTSIQPLLESTQYKHH